MLEPLFKFLQEHRRWRTINDTLVKGKVQVHHVAGLDEPGAATSRSATRPAREDGAPGVIDKRG